jgi:predicted enzyme related to lactoylglutathione lyase
MIKLDHLAIYVSDPVQSREWYRTHFGFTVEFEVPERNAIALQDDAGLTMFLVKDTERARHPSCGLTFQVADVEAKHRELAAAGVQFVNAPQKLYWGYGAELSDPDGYLIHLWAERTMREKSGA